MHLTEWTWNHFTGNMRANKWQGLEVYSMKITLIDVNYKSGSTGKIVFDLKGGLENEGHEVFVCYGRGPVCSEDKVVRFSTKVEVYFHAFMTRITGLTGFYSFFSTRKLLRAIKKNGPDIVHIHELHGYFVNIGPIMNYLKMKQIKTIWTFHCEFMYTGRCGYSYKCNRWKEHCGNCPQLSEYPATYFFDFSRFMKRQKEKWFESFSNLKIVTPSNWLAHRVKQSFLKDKPISVVYNGIDVVNTFYPRSVGINTKIKYDIPEEARIVLSVAPGIMSDRKGGEYVVQIAKQMIEENVFFVMVGVDDLTKSFPKNIIPISRTENQNELAELYSLADIFLLTSMKETFSLVCAESLACGTKVVGFDSGAPTEIAPDGYGKFVPHGDINSLIELIREALVEDKEIQKCRDFAVKNYSKERMYEEYKKLYLSE